MLETVLLSLKVAFVAILVLVPVGTGLGWLLARKQFRGRSLLQAVVMLPLVMPPVTVGYLLLILLGRHGVLGEPLGLEIAFTFSAAVLAASVVALPLVVRSVRIAFEMTDPRLEAAAGVLGSSRARTFITVTLPMIWPGIIGGLCLGFARAFGEFGATITFAGNIKGETRTLPLSIHTALQRVDGDATAWALVAVSIAVALGAFIFSEWMVRATRIRVGVTP